MRTAERRFVTVVVCLLISATAVAAADRKPEPGFNLFSKEDDIEIGKQGMKEIEKEVRLATNREINNYIQNIGRRLAQTPEAGEYPYTFKVVLDESINAFALPGGPTYIHTGLILAAENEAQLAGVMGHEIAHVALRHGTNRASKANLLQLGMLLGSSAAGGGIGGTLAQLGIGFGASSVLLRYSRKAEKDADILGAYMMARVGYNPIEAARFFETLEAQSGQRGAVAEFFSSHPNPGNRMERIQEEIQYMPRQEYTADTGKLPRMKSLIKRMEPPPKAAGKQQAPPISGSRERGDPIQASSKLKEYQGRAFEFAYPENWHVSESNGGESVTLVPDDGLVRVENGTAIARGVVAGISNPEQGRDVNLRRDTETLIQQMKQRNPSMEPVNNRPRRLRVDGSRALLTTINSNSPFAGEKEVDLLLTVERSKTLYYMVFIAPRTEYSTFQPTFERILRSVDIKL